MKKATPKNQPNHLFPKRLRSLMKEAQTTQAALGEAVGLSRQAISLYTNGTTTPDIVMLAKFANFFNVSYDYLLGITETKNQVVTDISRETGLSEEAVLYLRAQKSKTVSEVLENKRFYRIIHLIRGLKYIAKGEKTVRGRLLGQYKYIDKLEESLGKDGVFDYYTFLAAKQFQKLLEEMAPYTHTPEPRESTQKDIDDFFGRENKK